MLAGAAVLVALFVVLRNAGDDSPSGATTSATETTVTTTEASTTRTSSAAAGPVTLSIEVRGGDVTGGIQKAEAKKGDRVVIRVTSDLADEVHVHGYDRMQDVAPGAPARIAFAATIPGRFEIELEDRGLQIGELEVRP